MNEFYGANKNFLGEKNIRKATRKLLKRFYPD